MVVLGLLALLGLPDAALPPELAAGLPQLLSGLVRLLVDLKTQQEAAAAAAEEEDDEPEEVGYHHAIWSGGFHCMLDGRNRRELGSTVEQLTGAGQSVTAHVPPCWHPWHILQMLMTHGEH